MNVKKIILVAAVFAVIGSPAVVKAADATASAAATIAAPISISKVSDLEFGLIAPTASAGTVTVSTAGSRTGDANVDLLSGDTESAASFSVSGEADQTFALVVPTSAVLSATGSSGGADMTATLSDDAAATPTLDGSGAATVNVGAALAVGANQAADAYSGSFTVTVSYN